jgi:hypothetical protein
MKGPRGKRDWPRTIAAGSASVKIYQVAHETNASGKAYVLVWRTPAGRKSQKFADARAAIVEGKLKAAQLGAGRVEGADMTRGDRDELQAARQLAKGVPLLAALQEWAKGRELTAGNVLGACEAWAAVDVQLQGRAVLRLVPGCVGRRGITAASGGDSPRERGYEREKNRDDAMGWDVLHSGTGFFIAF